MRQILAKYLPENAVDPVLKLVERESIHMKIVNERSTRHGDFKIKRNGQCQITVNVNLNKYRFLLTTIHEIAHALSYKHYGKSIKPHGKEWKHVFRQLMLPLINPSIFPMDLLPYLAKHFKNPKASSDTDVALSLKLRSYDPASDKSYIFELDLGSVFVLRGKRFVKGKLRRKLYECKELDTNRVFLFQPHAEVDFIK
jgi:hypothetical protein